MRIWKEKMQKPIWCLQQNNIYKSLVMLLEHVPVQSESTGQLGWLVDSIYKRSESLTDCREQYPTILHLVLQKLSQILQLEHIDSTDKDKVILPYLYCTGNMIGVHNDMALEAGDQLSFHTSIAHCITSESTHSVRQLALWVISNFIVEPSCCVLIMGQRQLMATLLDSLSDSNESFSVYVLCVMERMSHISTEMCRHLIDLGLLSRLVPLLSSVHLDVTGKALSIVIQLVEVTQTRLDRFQADILESDLQKLLSPDVPENISSKARHLLTIL